MTDVPQYEEIPEYSRADVEAAIARNHPDELSRCVLSVGMHAPDVAWATDVCAQLARHPHPIVRGNAILSFGHIARVLHHLDRDTVLPIIARGLIDSDPYVRGQAESAADDIEHFLRWTVVRPGAT